MFTARHYTHEINLNITWRKFDSPANFERTTSFLVGVQWLPSQTTIERAITHLNLQRTDGRTEKDDARDQLKVAEKTLQKAVGEANRQPISRAEAFEFASLSYADLQRRFWENDGVNTFAVRYRKAAAEMGFRLPAKPVAAEGDDADFVMTPEIYRNMPARELQVRMRSPKIKLQIMQMIKLGQI